MITEEECNKIRLLEHFAGMMDCDGYISVRKNAHNDTYQQKIGFSNTNVKIIEWIVKNFGGKMPKEYVIDNMKYKNSYRWQLTGSNSYKLLKKIRPYLIIKCEQAELAIELYEKVTKWKYCTKNPIPNHKKELAVKLYQKCRALNKTGKSENNEEVELLVPVKVRKDVLDEWL